MHEVRTCFQDRAQQRLESFDVLKSDHDRLLNEVPDEVEGLVGVPVSGFDLKELGDWEGEYIQWFAELQKGTNETGIGFSDRVPDEDYQEGDFDMGYFGFPINTQ